MSRSSSSTSAPSLSPIAEQPESGEDDGSPLVQRQLRQSLSNLSLNSSGPTRGKGKGRRKGRPQNRKNKRKVTQFYRSIYSVFRSVYPRQQPPQNGTASPAERVEVDRARPPSSISTSSMCVLNSMVKELIVRFAEETNQLLDSASGRFTTLDAPEVLSAIRMMFGQNIDQFNTIVRRFGHLSANMPSRRRVRQQPQPRRH